MTREPKSNSEVLRELEALDFTRVHFPSDRVNILMLRQLHTELFDRGFQTANQVQPQYFFRPHPDNLAEQELGELLFCERLIATHAYIVAQGWPIPDHWEVDSYREQLTDSYRQLGLARGEHEASEMLRDVERQGSLLATQLGR